MFKINDYMWCRSKKEEVKLMSVEYNPRNGKITYICQSRFDDEFEVDFQDLVDLRYVR